MSYTCRVYKNSGFNAINIPDSPTMLNSCTYIDLPALELLQERFLSDVRVRTSWDNIKDADYCKIGDFYYYISNIQMVASDVARLVLIPDFVTSAGGPGSLDIIGGITSRVHVTDDSFGLYTSYDAYMSPAYMMTIDSYTHSFDNTQYTFVESTLALYTMGDEYENGISSNAIVATDESGEYKVTVPTPKFTNYTTTYSCPFGTLLNTEYQTVYRIDSGATEADTIRNGIAHARALGIEDCISGSYSIPSAFVNVSETGAVVNSLVGAGGTISISSLPFVYGSARNNRLWYGAQTPYTLVSAAGSTITSNAEEINGGGTAPSVYYMADPRRTGKPYFRFTPLNGKSSETLDFFRNCVQGTQWNNVPIVLREKSGSALDQINYNSSRQAVELQAWHQAEKTGRSLAHLGYEAGMGSLDKGVGIASNILNLKVGGAVQSLYDVWRNDLDYDSGESGRRNIELAQEQYDEAYSLAKAQEQAQFQISQNVTVPTIKFPIDPALMSEVTRNGFQVYRLKYDSRDIARIDKILTAYGYAHCKQLEASDFTNRQYFNYVASSISVSGLPAWWANGIASQIGTGVRVWHVIPDNSYYTNNPVA